MSNFQDVFNNVEETIQKKTVKKAGIYQKCKLVKSEWVEKEEDVEKKKKAYRCLLLTFNIPIENNDVAEFEHRIFQPAVKESDVAFCMDKYENGVAVRKLTNAEQIIKDHEAVSIELIQLLQALGNTFAQAKAILSNMIVGLEIPDVFKALSKGLVAKYPDGDKTPIDIKIIVYNNKNKQTSQLQISQPSLRNLGYTNHIEGVETKLAFSDYEMKNCMTFHYTGQNNPPKNDNLLVQDTAAGLPMDEGFSPDPTNVEGGLF